MTDSRTGEIVTIWGRYAEATLKSRKRTRAATHEA